MWGRTWIKLRCAIQIVSVCAPKCQINTLNIKVTKEKKKHQLKCVGAPEYNLDMICDIQIVSICAPKCQINTLNIKVTKEKKHQLKCGGAPEYNLDMICDIQIVSICAHKCQINTKEKSICQHLGRADLSPMQLYQAGEHS